MERGSCRAQTWNHSGQRIWMALSCEDYRFQQQLLALKKRLAEDKLNADERQEIEGLIEELERRLKM